LGQRGGKPVSKTVRKREVLYVMGQRELRRKSRKGYRTKENSRGREDRGGGKPMGEKRGERGGHWTRPEHRKERGEIVDKSIKSKVTETKDGAGGGEAEFKKGGRNPEGKASKPNQLRGKTKGDALLKDELKDGGGGARGGQGGGNWENPRERLEPREQLKECILRRPVWSNFEGENERSEGKTLAKQLGVFGVFQKKGKKALEEGALG